MPKKMNFDRKLDLSILSSDLTVYDDTKFPDSVKLICEAGTGYNNIDFDVAKEKKITVCNIPSYSSKRVAHTAIMITLLIIYKFLMLKLMVKR